MFPYRAVLCLRSKERDPVHRGPGQAGYDQWALLPVLLGLGLLRLLRAAPCLCVLWLCGLIERRQPASNRLGFNQLSDPFSRSFLTLIFRSWMRAWLDMQRCGCINAGVARA